MTWNTSLVQGPRQVAALGPADHEGGERPFLGWLPGYRMNVARSALTPEAEAFLMDPQPQSPRCVFAGDVLSEDGNWALTAFLVFPDEDAAKAALPALWTGPVDPPAEDPPEEGGEP